MICLLNSTFMYLKVLVKMSNLVKKQLKYHDDNNIIHIVFNAYYSLLYVYVS